MSSGIEEATATPWVPARPGGVGALTSWTAPDGGPRLASSGSDGTIQVWDPERVAVVQDHFQPSCGRGTRTPARRSARRSSRTPDGSRT